eukprot:TRINITY_DN2831_c0_g1_i2.p2 TRINITY_DN2831_c0_g1~~TRINITY_DN2831_c0_g1_i2.p2  ORF type:complete len:137 (-),score=11.73 TRINITY_DN2831_c0_g1_i2:630-1040(-)
MQEAQISASLSAESGPRAGEILFSWEVQGLTCTSKDWIGLYIHNRQYCNKYSAYFLTSACKQAPCEWGCGGVQEEDCVMAHAPQTAKRGEVGHFRACAKATTTCGSSCTGTTLWWLAPPAAARQRAAPMQWLWARR